MKWLGRLLLVLLAIPLALVGAELFVRAWMPAVPEFVTQGGATYDTSIFEYEILPLHLAAPGMENNVVGLIPGSSAQMATLEYSASVRVNQLGFRGPEAGPKTEEMLRILAIGDSFTMGFQHQEPDTWTELLEVALAERLGRPVDVLNGGVDQFGTDDAIRMMERIVPMTGAEIVLLTFYTGNDFTDNLPPEVLARELGLAGGPVSASPEPPPELEEPEWQRALQRRSYLYTYLLASLEARALASNKQATLLFREHLRMFDELQQLEALLPYTAEQLQRLHRACVRHDVDCFIALAPPDYAVHDDRLRATWSAYGLGEPPTPAQLEVPARLTASVIPPEIKAVDLAWSLREHSGRDLYFTFDGHWNARGNAVVAQALAEFMAPHLYDD